MSFYDQLQSTLTNSPTNRSVTENGAVGFRTTGKKLLDLNFAVSSLRSKSEAEIETRFAEALGEDFVTAVVWLFWARDIRGGGLGERRLFRVCMRYLAREFPDKVVKLIPLVAEYGRWDDLLCLLDTRVATTVANTFLHQLNEDTRRMREGKSISLAAKWMPSASTSSKETRKKAEQLQKAFGWHPAYYRRVLSTLRRYIDVTERKMSRNQWGEIKYEAVPSRANLNYNNAFLRHDEARRREYLGKLEKGETKINSSVLFPYDIVHKYVQHGGYYINGYDTALEAMWKGLPNTVEDGTGTIPVKENDLGVALVSGFSPNVAKMVMSGKLDPYEALLDSLNVPRYDAVREALK